MGRNNASKSKDKDKMKAKLSDDSKHKPQESETKKKTSHLDLPKKGDGDATSCREEQKQKLSRTKKSIKKQKASDDSIKETETSKTSSKENASSPKKNTRKRESPRFLPSPLAKIVPIFGKKRHAVQASLSQEDERQGCPANTSASQTGAEAVIGSISLVDTVKDKDEEGETVPKILSRTDEEFRESQCPVTDPKVDVHIASHATSGESEIDLSKGSTDEQKSVPSVNEIQSISAAMAAENKEHNNKESGTDDHGVQDEAKYERDVEEENAKHPLKVVDKEVMVTVCQAASEGIKVGCQSGSDEDHHEHNAHDDNQESEDREMLTREVAEEGCPGATNVLQAFVEVYIKESEKACTEHGPIKTDIETSTTGIKNNSDSMKVDGNQDIDEEGKLMDSTSDTINVVDTKVVRANEPVCPDNEVCKYSHSKDNNSKINDSDTGLQVSGDGQDERHSTTESKEDVHDCAPEGKDNSVAKPDIRTMSDGDTKSCSDITSYPQQNSTHRELSQAKHTRGDGMEVGVERSSNGKISEQSGEETGDLMYYASNKKQMQCTISIEDMNPLRRDITPVCSSNQPEFCNVSVSQTNGNADGEIEGCSDLLFGSTQQFEVPQESHSSSSQSDNAILSNVDGEKPKESENFSELQGKLNEDSGTEERKDIPTFNFIDVPQLSCQEFTEQNFLEQDPLDDDMMDLTDSQMIELDQQCSMVNQLTKPLTSCAATTENATHQLRSKVHVSVGVQTLNTCTVKSESTSIVQSMIRDIRQLNATVLDLKRQMDSFRRLRSQTAASNYSQQHWNEYRTRGKPFYQQ